MDAVLANRHFTPRDILENNMELAKGRLAKLAEHAKTCTKCGPRKDGMSGDWRTGYASGAIAAGANATEIINRSLLGALSQAAQFAATDETTIEQKQHAGIAALAITSVVAPLLVEISGIVAIEAGYTDPDKYLMDTQALVNGIMSQFVECAIGPDGQLTEVERPAASRLN